jgi:hypothetical protein
LNCNQIIKTDINNNNQRKQHFKKKLIHQSHIPFDWLALCCVVTSSLESCRGCTIDAGCVVASDAGCVVASDAGCVVASGDGCSGDIDDDWAVAVGCVGLRVCVAVGTNVTLCKRLFSPLSFLCSSFCFASSAWFSEKSQGQFLTSRKFFFFFFFCGSTK